MVVNRSYAITLFDHMPLLIATGVSMTLGMLWIRKIIDKVGKVIKALA